MKKVAWVVLGLIALAATGCAQKSDSEKALDKMQGDMNKAANNMKKSLNG